MKEGVQVVFGRKVSKVDIKSKKVFIEDRSICFDKLVLATGSKSLIPTIKGVNKRGVFLLKTIEDAENICRYPAKKVVVLGAGPIGMETAIAFRNRGIRVLVIEKFNCVLPRLFDDRPAWALRQICEKQGIEILTEESVMEIVGNGSVKGLITDKRKMDCDTVIISIGASPNTELAKQIGLNIGNHGGIKTDECMMTSAEDVYACGDCVESKDIITGENILSPLWHNAKRQGWVAGCNCSGKRVKFNGSFNVTGIEIFGNYALSMGRSAASFECQSHFQVIEKGFDTQYYRLIIANDRLAGVQLINRIERAGLLASTMWRKDTLAGLRTLVQNEKLLSMNPWLSALSLYIGK